MDVFADLTKNLGQLILSILFIIYLFSGTKLPSTVADLIDTLPGKVVVIIVAVMLFYISNPILGVLGLIVAYQLIINSSVETGSSALDAYLPTEKKKATNMTALNQFPYTLEQEVVKKMAPLNKPNSEPEVNTFKPILDDLHDAAPINYAGVI
jgi:hypothetical protein